MNITGIVIDIGDTQFHNVGWTGSMAAFREIEDRNSGWSIDIWRGLVFTDSGAARLTRIDVKFRTHCVGVVRYWNEDPTDAASDAGILNRTIAAWMQAFSPANLSGLLSTMLELGETRGVDRMRGDVRTALGVV